MSKSYPKLIAVVGESGSGKSSLAMNLAGRFEGEIINADSWQVYKGFDIGTAKPTPKEQAQVPHHLIDVADAKDGFNAALYKRLADDTIAYIQSRGKLPILVGGTGLYVDAVLYDFSFMPVGNTSKRQELAKLTIKDLLVLINQQGLDMNGIDPRNKRRLIRLIESNGRKPSRSELRHNTLIIGLRLSRSALRNRIENRVEMMLKDGLKNEVKGLAEAYGWENEAMKGIGYKEFTGYFSGELSNSQLKHRIVKSTLDLAKRQRTWFKRNRDIKWVDNQAEAIKLATDFLER